MESFVLEEALAALGELLAEWKSGARLVVVGGAALNLRGDVSRTTNDVEVIARARLEEDGTVEVFSARTPSERPCQGSNCRGARFCAAAGLAQHRDRRPVARRAATTLRRGADLEAIQHASHRIAGSSGPHCAEAFRRRRSRAAQRPLSRSGRTCPEESRDRRGRFMGEKSGCRFRLCRARGRCGHAITQRCRSTKLIGSDNLPQKLPSTPYGGSGNIWARRFRAPR